MVVALSCLLEVVLLHHVLLEVRLANQGVGQRGVGLLGPNLVASHPLYEDHLTSCVDHGLVVVHFQVDDKQTDFLKGFGIHLRMKVF